MIRWLVILMLLVGGVPRAGVAAAAAPGGGACGARCHERVVRTTCCGEVVEESACPMSGGACRCTSPVPGDRRGPSTPLPRDGRDAPAAMPTAAPEWKAARAEEAEASRPVVLGGPRVGLSHNGVQALLGVWRR
jgi:hypothetical protein